MISFFPRPDFSEQVNNVGLQYGIIDLYDMLL